MAKTTEELIAKAEEKATKTETKRCIASVKESFAAAIEAQEDKGTVKILKTIQKDVLAALKA
jgi:hypothetical protein